MNKTTEVLVLGIGNVLWADEGFGVRTVEALHAGWAFPAGVRVIDGGTQGLNLLEDVADAARVLVFDAIDYGLAPGTLKVLRGAEVPVWGARKLSPHQNGFNDVLALATLHDRAPHDLAAVGVQPVELNDLGGSLTAPVRAQVPAALEHALRIMAEWGFAGRARVAGEAFEPLNDGALRLEVYEAGRPSAEDACRVGDVRILERTAASIRGDA